MRAFLDVDGRPMRGPGSSLHITPLFNSLMLGSSGFAAAPPAGMSLWLRSDTLTQVAGFVTQWTDKSGNGFNMTPGVHPSYNASDANWSNKASVGFDGLTQYLASTAISSQIIGAATGDIFIVCRPTAAGPGTDLTRNMLGALYDQNGNWGTGFGSTQAGIQQNGGGGTSIGQAFSVNTKYNLEFRMDSGSLITSVSGKADATTPAGTIATLTQVFNLGQNVPFSLFFAGTKVEVLVYPTALSPANRAIARSYITGQWGIPW